MKRIKTTRFCVEWRLNLFRKLHYKIDTKDVKELVSGYGYCFASIMVTVEGKGVNYMYKECPDNKNDSGWRFFSGYEDDDYVNNSKNVEIYDVNTIANYAPDIISLLDSEIGHSFERDMETKKWNLVE